MNVLTAVVVTSVAASLALAPVAWAQTSGPAQTPSRSPSEKQRDAFKAPEGVVEASKLVGTKVRDSAGKDLGEIDQLLVDAKTGKVTHAVIGKGGVLGVGESKVAVPWSDVNLKVDASNRDRMVGTVESSTMDAAPRYDRRAVGADRPAASPRTDDKKATDRPSGSPTDRPSGTTK